jgi:coenzyme F420 hydrogenase subunit beta
METDGTYAVVGLACHIQGIRKAMSVIPKLKKRIILCLSLLCSHSDTFFATSSFLHKYCTEKEIKNITHLDYRGGGWPGFVKIHFKNNKIMSIPVEKYMLFHSMCFFEQKRCFLCCDSISRLSDITVMDAWVPEIMHSDKQGTSLLIVRTKEGARLCKQAQFLKVVGLQPFPSTRLIRSQGAQRLSNRDLPVFLLFKKIVNQYLPSYDLVIPSPKPLNYQRALLMSLNSWISSKAILNNFVHPIAQMECTAQRQVIKRLSKQ